MIDRQARPLLGELLVERGLLDRTQLKIALGAQRPGSERLGETLVRLGLITRGQVAGALAEQRRLWLAALVSAAMVALNPAAGMARTASTQMRVSVEVENSATVAAPAATVAVGHAGASSTPVALRCTQPSFVQVALVRARLEPGGAATETSPYFASSPGRLAPVQAVSQQTVSCAASGPGVAVEVPVPSQHAADPADQLELQIAY
ncbi:MAG TPA: hypothetical protein VN802_09900 [Stellaceae bacterium]|nr:hypothetical protein [Stellaceae bacterium]